MNKHVTLAVLGTKLDALTEANDLAHSQLIEQVRRTNGSVSNLKEWKNRLIGGWID